MNLKTTYLGLELKNPIVPSAGPFSRSLQSMKELEDNGASAIVMHSIFEEQFKHEAAELDHYLSYGTESFAEALSYFPKIDEYKVEPDDYLDLIHEAKKSLDIPVIGSMNGITNGGWIEYAKKIEEAGADAVELNIYYIPTDPKLTSSDIEKRYVEVLKSVKSGIKIPVAVKLSPYFTSMPGFIKKLDDTGADGLVLFNRFYQPDIDLESMEVKPEIVLSTPFEMKLPLRWMAILYGKVKANLAATTGIYNAEDVLKMTAAGADVTMMCSAILTNGPKVIKKTLTDLEAWLNTHEYESLRQMKGSMSQKSVADPAAFERANYMKALNNYK
jgi:dihydroorotate dehydrogenase (fumarate)